MTRHLLEHLVDRRLLLFRGAGHWRAETCHVTVDGDRLSATGTQLGVTPIPYRLEYTLDTSAGWVTTALVAEVVGEGWWRHLELRRSAAGQWSHEVAARGSVDLPAPDGPLPDLAQAVDCDLGWSPLTNVLPVRRLDLHRAPGSAALLMAWVAVPALSVHRSEQRYDHVRTTPTGAIVRYLGAHRGFEGDLELDHDGFVLRYPDLAERVTGDRAP
jgi:hypothetical protein